MRKLIILSFILITGICRAAIDLSEVDRMFAAEDFKGCEAELQLLLGKAATPAEKCDIYWRLARLQVVFGEGLTSKEEKRPLYAKGKEFAEKAIAADPKNPNGYMWHSANVGRESQTKGLAEQAKIVPVITGDLETILNKLGAVEMSEAWQALSEIYFRHPFKSTDSAENFCRKAVMSIPAGECRLSTYAFYAELLNSRGNSASKRKSAIDAAVSEFRKGGKSNIEKYESFEGSLGSSYVPAWSSKSIGSMSDKEEALAVVEYAIGLYNRKAVKTAQDRKDYTILKSYKEKWQ